VCVCVFVRLSVCVPVSLMVFLCVGFPFKRVKESKDTDDEVGKNIKSKKFLFNSLKSTKTTWWTP
jgi:hypothetical protein